MSDSPATPAIAPSNTPWIVATWAMSVILMFAIGFHARDAFPRPVVPVDPAKPVVPDKPVDPVVPVVPDKPVVPASPLAKIGREYRDVLAETYAQGWDAGKAAFAAGAKPDEAMDVVAKAWGKSLLPRYQGMIGAELHKIAPDPAKYDKAQQQALSDACSELAKGLRFK